MRVRSFLSVDVRAGFGVSALVLVLLGATLLGVAPPASAGGTTHFGVTFPEGDRSFADIAEWQILPSYPANEYTNPDDAEGPPDCLDSDDGPSCFVSLGREPETGLLELTFVDNALTADGTAADDLYFFEVGSAGQGGGVPESFSAEISADGTEWLSVGEVGGGPGNGVDIDPVADRGVEYRHVRVAATSSSTGGPTFGPDIDAVGAISSVAAAPPPGEPADPPSDPVGPPSDPGTPGVPALDYLPSVLDDLAGMFRTSEIGVGGRILVHSLGGDDGTVEVIGRIVRTTEEAVLCYQFGDSLLSGQIRTTANQGLEALQGYAGYFLAYDASCRPTAQEVEIIDGVVGEDGLVTFTVDDAADAPGGTDIEPVVVERQAPRVNVVDGRDPGEVAGEFLQGIADDLGWPVGFQGSVGAEGGSEFNGGGDRVLFVATDAQFADALSMSGVTGVARALTLQISPTDREANLAAIQRLRPTRLVVVGGELALPDHVLPDPAEVPWTRVFGQTRFETSVALSQTYYPDGASRVIVATGANYPDALSGGAIASLQRDPLLLVGTDVVPDQVAEELDRLDPAEIVVMGGTAAVSDEVVSTLGAYAPVERYQGANRFHTAAVASQQSTGSSAQTTASDVVYLANGEDFRNALTVASNAWVYGGPLLLTSPTYLPDETATELRRLDPDHVVVLTSAFEFENAVHLDLADLSSP